jgi:hypothetical protein
METRIPRRPGTSQSASKRESHLKHEYLETHLAKHEYIEGPQATENFESLARAVFQAKKTVAPVKAMPKKKVRKTSGKDKA